MREREGNATMTIGKTTSEAGARAGAGRCLASVAMRAGAAALLAVSLIGCGLAFGGGSDPFTDDHITEYDREVLDQLFSGSSLWEGNEAELPYDTWDENGWSHWREPTRYAEIALDFVKSDRPDGSWVVKNSTTPHGELLTMRAQHTAEVEIFEEDTGEILWVDIDPSTHECSYDV